MKIAYASDLHLEFGPLAASDLLADADYLVLAGDVAESRFFHQSMNKDSSGYKEWNERLYNLILACSNHYKKVILILGNHEYYHSRIGKAEQIIEKFCDQFPNVVMLQDSCIELEGLKVFGSTMWADMGLDKDPLAEFKLKMGMNDFRAITYKDGTNYRKFAPHHAAAIHANSVQLAIKEQPDIIIQHHAPSEKSVPPQFKGSDLNGAYYSEVLEDALIDKLHPQLIIHGHIHNETDYVWSTTRVIANPRGYSGIERVEGWKVKVVEI